MKQYFVYILASYKNGTLYIGMTGFLERRIFLHQSDLIKGFTKRYVVHDLVYFEEYSNPQQAIEREKQLKKWNRQWKINLIEKNNPNWNDLSEELWLSSSRMRGSKSLWCNLYRFPIRSGMTMQSQQDCLG